MTSSPHGPYVLGYTRATMASTKGSNTVTWSKSHKACLSTDRGLQFALLKLESLVIVISNATVNMFLSLVHTARQATGAGSARSR